MKEQSVGVVLSKEDLVRELNSGNLYMIGSFKSAADIREMSGKSSKTGRDYHLLTRTLVIEQEETGRTVDVEIGDDEAKTFEPPVRMARVLVRVWHAASSARGYQIKARWVRVIQ